MWAVWQPHLHQLCSPVSQQAGAVARHKGARVGDGTCKWQACGVEGTLLPSIGSLLAGVACSWSGSHQVVQKS
jgi:hypothetical protein